VVELGLVKGAVMTQSELLTKLAEVKHELHQRFGIEQIALFGSYARGEETQESDVDIAILKSSRKNFFLRMKAIDFLKEYLHKDVDMGYFDSMRTFIKNRIKKDLIVV
jgi:predicted nucleotidyltransferase